MSEAKTTLDIIIERYGMRLNTSKLALALDTTPDNIRTQIATDRFPIPVYKDNDDAERAPWYADARDVADFLDRKRAKALARASRGQGAYNA